MQEQPADLLYLLQPPIQRYSSFFSLHSQFPPEREEGNVEYKQKLDPSPLRFQHLLSQMKWRLSEVGTCFYLVGIEDSGKIRLGNSSETLQQSLSVLLKLAEAAEAQIISTSLHHPSSDESFLQVCICSFSSASNANALSQINVCFFGPAQGGKSTLISCLSTWKQVQSIEEGFESMRLEMLKHRHEILSGVTSSISYRYRVHENALLRAIDTPGCEKYRKTLFKCLTTHCIDAVVVAFDAADEAMSESFAFFGSICRAISVPFVVAICKTDSVTAKEIATNLHSLLAEHSAFAFEIVQNESCHWNAAQEKIPIVLTSCKTGEGMEQLLQLLCTNSHKNTAPSRTGKCKFQLQKILKVTPEACILYGQTIAGSLSTTTSDLVLGPIPRANPSFIAIHPISVMIDGKAVECIPASFSGSILIQEPSINEAIGLHAGMSILQVDSKVKCGVLQKFSVFLAEILPLGRGSACFSWASVTNLMARGLLMECCVKETAEKTVEIELVHREDAFLVRPGDVVVLFGNTVGIGRVLQLKKVVNSS